MPPAPLSGDDFASYLLLEFPEACVTVSEAKGEGVEADSDENSGDDNPSGRLFFTDDGSRTRSNIWPVSSVHCRVKTSDIPNLLKAAQSYVSLMTRGGTLAGTPLVEEVSKEHEERDWMRIVQEDWKPRLVGVASGNPTRALVVSLPFHTPSDVSALLSAASPSSAAVEIKLTGGGAFGTGEHVTTRMCSIRCLSLVERIIADGPVKVLDYGAGSGLISLACLTARGGEEGAVKAYGVEVDRTAVEAARVNAELNGWTVGREFEMYRPPKGAPGAELWDEYTGCESQDPTMAELGVDELPER